jgi:hypothetical protein
MNDQRHVELPYMPRKHFEPLHASQKRWIFVVAHRRCGKTVALVNQLIRAALNNKQTSPPPRYAYVGPSFDAAKDMIWTYAKQFTKTVEGIRYLEGELTVLFPKGATIKLYGGALAYERMRGLYFNGIVMDEYAMLHPQAFTSVVRPALGDYLGWAVISGTPAGQDHFYNLKLKAETDPNWDIFEIPITDTGEDALTHAEVEEMRKDMAPDEFAREMLCSFDAPVEGAYYQDSINTLQTQGRVTKVSVDLNTSVFTGWDLGLSDLQCIWLGQIVGREYHWIDYIEDRGKRLSLYADELAKRADRDGFKYRAHLCPHDIEARELMTGHSRRQELASLLDAPVITVPRHDPADGIVAARGILGLSWFDEAKTRRGLARLRSYRRSKTGTPIHDDASHGADAFRTAAVGIPLIGGGQASKWGAAGRLRRRLRGLV